MLSLAWSTHPVSRFFVVAAIAIASMGCGPLVTLPDGNRPTPIVNPSPTPINVEAHAGKCLGEYAARMADVFRKAAREMSEDNQADVSEKMGDGLKDARIKAFMPLMQKLDQCDGDHSEMEKLLNQWAGQLEKVK